MENLRIETPDLIIKSFLPTDSFNVAHYRPSVSYWMSDMILKDEIEALIGLIII